MHSISYNSTQFLLWLCSGGLSEISQEDEAHLLIHSLQDANMPKFLAEDVPLFQSIMADLFPGITLPQQDTGALEVSGSLLYIV